MTGKLPIEFSKEQLLLLEEMNDFNLEARYPDEQMEFYKKANKKFAEKYKKVAEGILKWLQKQL